jgi:hypothetical protein
LNIERGDDSREQLPCSDECITYSAAAQEKPGQTLDATALVHEAHLRLVGTGCQSGSMDNRGHFFAAAASVGASVKRPQEGSARRRPTNSIDVAWHSPSRARTFRDSGETGEKIRQSRV